MLLHHHRGAGGQVAVQHTQPERVEQRQQGDRHLSGADAQRRADRVRAGPHRPADWRTSRGRPVEPEVGNRRRSRGCGVTAAAARRSQAGPSRSGSAAVYPGGGGGAVVGRPTTAAGSNLATNSATSAAELFGSISIAGRPAASTPR